MRPERTLKTLEDVRDAASFILEITKNKSQEDYFRERLFRQAVERNFEIIGEAVGRLVREDPETAAHIGERERIVAFRNVLIHGYDLVNDELVWDTVKTKVPVLLAEVEGLIEAKSGQTGL